MENLSLLPGDGVWNNVTTSSVDDDYHSTYLANIRYVAFKIIYIIIGTIGVLDNVFVIVVFALFIKITQKVGTLDCKSTARNRPYVLVLLFSKKRR